MEERTIEEMMGEIEAQTARIREPFFTSKAYPDRDWYLNAQLHVTPEQWDTYAEGYKRAGDIIVQYVIDSHSYQDFLVYPIAFLYRQYLELRLKELIRVSSSLLAESVGIPTDHNLLSLWRKVRLNIEQVWPNSQMKSHLDTVGYRLKELCSVDPGSDAFRYPEDRRGASTLAGMEHINLRQLRDVIQGVSNILDGASLGMGEYLKAKHEMHNEYPEY